MSEWYFCKATGFQILPGSLRTGSVDVQPAAEFLFWASLVSYEAGEEERIRAYLSRRRSAEAKRKR